MNPRFAPIIGLLLAAVTPASAHRLDEYLQATIISVEQDVLKADMYLTPGLAVLPAVLAAIDRDGDGVISPAEQRAYAERVLGDLSLTLDGERLSPRLVTVEFSKLEEIKEGRGDIHLEFTATLPPKKSARHLRLENHHFSALAAYQVNCLVPNSPAIQIGPEHRNYEQSVYELNYTQASVAPAASRLASR